MSKIGSVITDRNTMIDNNSLSTAIHCKSQDSSNINQKNSLNKNTSEVILSISKEQDSMKYEPKVKTMVEYQGVIGKAEDAVTNKESLSADSRYSWAIAPDVKQIGTGRARVRVDYPDKSVDAVWVPITVQEAPDSLKYEPEIKQVTVNQDAIIKAEDAVTNKESLPADSRYSWAIVPDTHKNGYCFGRINVLYHDGSVDGLWVPVIVGKDKSTISEDKIDEIDNLLEDFKFDGTLSVYKNGKNEWNYTTAPNFDSAYLINSTQKALTGELVMQEIAKEKIDFNDRLSKYYPTAPNADNISILDLLEMKSGYDFKGILGERKFISNEGNMQYDLKHITYDEKLYKKWHYHSINYIILSNILQKVTGKTYEDLFRENYINKLNLKHSEFVWALESELK